MTPRAHRVFLSAYAVFQPGLLRHAALLARSQGVRVMLDLASWETLRSHAGTIHEILAEGLVDCCICNEVFHFIIRATYVSFLFIYRY